MAEFNLEVSTEERRRAGAVVDLQVVPGNAISPDGTIARTNTVTPMQNGCPTARHTSISDCVRLDRRHARALNYLLAGILSIFGVSCDSGVKHSESPAGETAQQTPP